MCHLSRERKQEEGREKENKTIREKENKKRERERNIRLETKEEPYEANRNKVLKKVTANALP